MGAGPGTVLQMAGSREAGRAAQAAAVSQQDAAGRERRDVLRLSDSINDDLMNLANASPQELNSLQAAFDSSTRQLDREERMIAALDPSILEASKQALQLMRGDNAAVNNPLMGARNAQRQQLLNSLRSQYGPGAESSSIGQRALSQFDMESNSMFAQNQQNSLSQMFGIANTDLGGRMSRATQNFIPISQGYGALTDRKLQARQVGAQGQLNAFMGTGQNIVNSAGARYVSQAIQGQAMQSAGQQWQESDSQMAGSMMGGMTSMMSDERVKENVAPLDVDALLNPLDGVTWDYKFGPTGMHAGVMAQSLEQSDVGRTLVSEDAHGIKHVDLAKSVGVLLATVAELHKKIKALESERGN